MRLLFLLCLLLTTPLSVLADSPTALIEQAHRQAFLANRNGPLQLSELAARGSISRLKSGPGKQIEI